MTPRIRVLLEKVLVEIPSLSSVQDLDPGPEVRSEEVNPRRHESFIDWGKDGDEDVDTSSVPLSRVESHGTSRYTSRVDLRPIPDRESWWTSRSRK